MRTHGVRQGTWGETPDCFPWALMQKAKVSFEPFEDLISMDSITIPVQATVLLQFKLIAADVVDVPWNPL